MVRQYVKNCGGALTQEQDQVDILQQLVRTDDGEQLQRIVDPVDSAIFLKVLKGET